MIESEDFQILNSVWNNEDKLLLGLQHKQLFQGKTRWCDLSTVHWRVLIARNLTIVLALDEVTMKNNSHPTILSLRYVLAGFISHLQFQTDSIIDIMRISRMDELTFTIDYTASMGFVEIPKPTLPFRLVVDND